MSFIRTGIRELGLKVRRQRTRMALRRQRRVLQRSEIALGREGMEQAGNFPELRNEIVALKKLEQEQREVASRIAQLEEALRQIEAERQRNADAQNAAIAELEEKKKPLLQRRGEAKGAADLCEREFSSVDRRLQDSDAADAELLKKLSDLHATVPPPADLDAQSAAISAKRARLPDERAQIMQARLGAEDACRQATQKLTTIDGELEGIDKQIAAVRAEYEAKDRVVNEQARTQQEALKEARSHHQVVEERKNPAYLNIGRHLGTQGIAPPNAPHLLSEVQQHRATMDTHAQHAAELAIHSSQIDKQELRKFYFSIVSLFVLLAIVLPLVFQTPRRREWLPQETEAILSLNLDALDRDDLPKRWRKDKPDEWQKVSAGLLGPALNVPVLNLSRDAFRVTRAMATQTGGTREFVLIEARGDVSRVLHSVEGEQGFTRRTINGLPVWESPNFALARVGPKTLAVGTDNEVNELVRVRLGMTNDLEISGQLWDRFQALDQGSALRLISRDPTGLAQLFHPLFAPDLVNASQLLGLSISLQNPPRAHLLVKTTTPAAAQDLARKLRDTPQRFLTLADSGAILFAGKPQVQVQNANVDARFDVPENSARLLLQRIARTDGPQQLAAQ